MEETKEIIKCDICNEINNKGTHYCKKCGKNLSVEKETPDILFFISKIFNWIGILRISVGILLISLSYFFNIGILYIILLPLYIIIVVKTNEIFPTSYEIVMYEFAFIYFIGISIILFILSWSLKKIALKLCQKNINKEQL